MTYAADAVRFLLSFLSRSSLRSPFLLLTSVHISAYLELILLLFLPWLLPLSAVLSWIDCMMLLL